MLNIAIVFHGFRGDAKAISKTARRCRRSTAAIPAQRLAILPWPSDLPLDVNGQRPVPRIGSGAAGQKAEASCAPPQTRGIFPRANFSTANTKPFNQHLVTPLIHAPKIIENLPALRHE